MGHTILILRQTWQPTTVFLPGDSLWMKEPGRLISNILKDLSSLSDSIVFLYFFVFTYNGLLFSPPILWNSAFIWVLISLSPLPFTIPPSSAICKTPSDNSFASLNFLFFRMVYTLLRVWCYEPRSIILQVHSLPGSNPLNLFVTSIIYS